MYRNYKLLRYVIYTIEAYFLYALEQTPNLLIDFGGIKPLPIISLLVYIGLSENKFTSMIFGILIGLLLDASYGGLLGINALVLGFCSYILANMCLYFIKTNFLTAMFFSGIFSLTTIIIDFCVNNHVDAYVFIWKSWYFPIIINTMLITLPIYFFNRIVSYCTRERTNEKYKF